MSFAALPLSTIVNVSVAALQQGAGAFNTSNLAVFTRDVPVASSFGTAGYKIYLSPTQVGTDFGTTSVTYAMANAIFSQQPNILAPGGYLVVIPYLSTAQDQQVTITFPGAAAASGNWLVTYNGNSTTALTYNESAAALQTALRLLSGLGSATVTGSMAAGFAINAGTTGVGFPFVVKSEYSFTVSAANATAAATYSDSLGNIFTVVTTIVGGTTLLVTGSGTPPATGTLTKVSGTGDATITFSAYTTLVDASSNVINPVVSVVVPGSTSESLDQAINRTQGTVQYFGILPAEILSQVVLLASAAVVQALNKLLFVTSYTAADVAPGGMFDLIRSGSFTQTRCLPYFESVAASQPTTSLVYAASYAGSGLSVIFTGSNTTTTQNLKTLVGVQPDPSMNPTLYLQCQAAGCDVYAAIATPTQSIGKIICSGLNDFFDNQYNLQWFVTALQISGFNFLATVATKVPQTESGMDAFKGSQRVICEQARTNQFLAPGAWNSATTFGNQADLIANVAQRGYYIYSAPISQQLQTNRVARQAPLIQIAAKYAGAIHSGTVVVYVNP